jgi:osmoprotectant transport system substrate-binding protein
VALTGAVILLAGCGGGGGSSGTDKSNEPSITIGTKNFTEQFILGELYRQALEANGFHVNLKQNIGSSEIVDRALTAGNLDMYPEYTGVMLSEIAGIRKRPASPEAAYQAAAAFQQKRGFVLLAMTPFSDSNALAVTPAYARKNGVRSIPDLGKVGRQVTIGAPPEFTTRFEGLVGLMDVYHLSNLKVKPLKIGDQYPALSSGKVDAAAVFTTDGQLERNAFVVLRDPRNLFAFQNVAPVIRRDLVERYPKLRTVIDSVSKRVTTEAMRSMNAAAVQRHQSPAVVARHFLQQAGIVNN